MAYHHGADSLISLSPVAESRPGVRVRLGQSYLGSVDVRRLAVCGTGDKGTPTKTPSSSGLAWRSLTTRFVVDLMTLVCTTLHS